jgi:GLPGLI family protein
VTKTRDGRSVVAWYTEDIQSSAGPEVYGGLPGLILQLDINGGEMVLTAVELATQGMDKGVVKEPVDGKKITRAAFQKMMDEQFGPGGPGGRTTIRIMRD